MSRRVRLAAVGATLGDRAASLWVLADTPGAHASYTRNGFVPGGCTRPTRRGVDLDEVRLLRA